MSLDAKLNIENKSNISPNKYQIYFCPNLKAFCVNTNRIMMAFMSTSSQVTQFLREWANDIEKLIPEETKK